MRIRRIIGITLVCAGSLSCHRKDQFSKWEYYRGDPGANCYSVLDQINRRNISDLEPAWTFRTGDAAEGNGSTIECNPIIVDGIIYLTSPQLRLFALDAATGRKIWMFNPFGPGQARDVNRGVAYWRSGNEKRILFPAYNRLYAIDAENGEPVKSFGNNGYVDLREGLDRDPEKLYVTGTTPGLVYKDLYITGHATGEGDGAAPGYIRAYNVRTGKLEWTFHTIPHPGETGYETWKNKDGWKIFGGANAWAGLALDPDRGIVYCPTGSVAPDFYGGDRKGNCLYADCLIALDAATGRKIWHFQDVHHNIWDYDLPSTPNLIILKRGGKKIYAVAQITKMGHIFVFDRETGEPVYPVEERPVPQSDIEGEETSPTQPFPVAPPPFVRQGYTDDDLPTISEESRKFAEEKLKTARNEGIFTPLSYEGTVVFPGFRGGGEWSGASFDFETGILYVNANQIPNLVSIIKTGGSDTGQETLAAEGAELYRLNCALCHGSDRKGQEVFPSLIGVGSRLTIAVADNMIQHGKGVMPAFPQLSSQERKAILAYIMGTDQSIQNNQVEESQERESSNKTRFTSSGYAQFRDEQGYPAVEPPWGTLSAIDMNRGEILWQKPLGEFSDLTAKGIPPTGTQNFGGSLVTAGGLVFIGATADEKLRAFDKSTGEILWEFKLPYGGYATPSTYEVDNIQYVVIAAGGGGKVGTKSGDVYMAFRLKNHK
jgi:quinoprotein glucose dehydrogenase